MSGLNFDSTGALARRRVVERQGFRAENVSLPHETYDFSWDGSSGYLAIHDVLHQAGEMVMDGGTRRTKVRDIRRRITFAPQGVSATGWCAPSARQNKLTVLLFDQKHMLDRLELSESGSAFSPLLHVLNPEIESTLAKLARVVGDPDIVEDVLVDALMLIAVAEAMRVARHRPALPRAPSLSDAQLDRVVDLIEARLSERMSLHDMAQAAGLSDYHFGRAFRSKVGISPYQLLLRRRVERAKALILAGLPLAEVAAQSGFSGASQFSRTFMAIAGETPRAFRKRMRGG